MDQKMYVLILVTIFSMQNCSCNFDFSDSGKGSNKRQKEDAVLENRDYSQHGSIQGFFAAHHWDYQMSKCGKINKHGIIKLEAMLYALKRLKDINFQQFDYRIIDTCENVAGLLSVDLEKLSYNHGNIVGSTLDEAYAIAMVQAVEKIAVISPTVSSSLFDNQGVFNNFFRTIPSEIVQFTAILEICQRFQWKFISTIFSFNIFGQKQSDYFFDLADKKEVCISQNQKLPRHAKISNYNNIVNKLTSVKNADVVILFTSAEDTKGILRAARPHNGRFTWIFPADWVLAKDHIHSFNDTAKGALLLQYANQQDEEFERYFLNLTLQNKNYTWFREFWSEMFDCNAGLNISKPACSGNESLDGNKIGITYMPIQSIISAVETIACAANSSNKIASHYRPSRDTLSFIRDRSSTCSDLKYSVKFNEHGYLNRDIQILNFNGISFKKVGLRRKNDDNNRQILDISTENITWMKNEKPVSFCSQPCKPWQIRLTDSKKPTCCFSCKNCSRDEKVVDNTCKKCEDFHIADEDHSKCKKLQEKYVSLKRKETWPPLIGSALGLCFNTWFFGLFIKHRNSAIVKASSKEVSFIMFVSLYVCFLSPYVFLVKPTTGICAISRFVVGMSLMGCYTPLLIKTNRIYRIFQASEKCRFKPSFVSTKSQIFICLCLLGMQFLICIIWHISDPVKVNKKIENSAVFLTCKYDTSAVIFLNFIPCFILMAMSTVYAFRTRKLPSNFNEARTICLTMYASCLVWSIFILLMLIFKITKKDPWLEFLIAYFVIIIGLVILIGLFGPKVKKILFSNENREGKKEMFHGFEMSSFVESRKSAEERCASDEEDKDKKTFMDAGTNT